MKKLFAVLMIISFLTACSNDAENKTEPAIDSPSNDRTLPDTSSNIKNDSDNNTSSDADSKMKSEPAHSLPPDSDQLMRRPRE